jgi:hypothetical protein
VCVRNENGGSSSTSLLDSVRYVRKNGFAEMFGAGFLGVCSSNDLCAYVPVSIPLLGYQDNLWRGRIPYSIACCAWKLP